MTNLEPPKKLINLKLHLSTIACTQVFEKPNQTLIAFICSRFLQFKALPHTHHMREPMTIPTARLVFINTECMWFEKDKERYKIFTLQTHYFFT
jgi:hypothetical protein